MHSKTLIKTAFMALLALGLLSGCGSNSLQDSDGGTNPQDSTSTPTPPAITVVVPVSTATTTPKITGTCVAGNTVELSIDASTITPTAVCTAGGTYSITPDTPLAVGGPYTITGTQTTAGGTVSPVSSAAQVTITATPFSITSKGSTTLQECNPVSYAVTTAGATGVVTYAITGGADAANFSIDANTGVVSSVVTPDFETKASLVYEVTASDAGSGSTDVETVTVTVTDFQTTKNGFDYGCVTNNITGEVWLDRNLGAAQICTSSTDVACYGDYYQWGRDFDGHQDSTSGTTARLSPTLVPGHGDFITINANPADWTSTDGTGATRSTNWAASDGSSICPTGYRVPLDTELDAERLSWSTNNAAGALAGTVKWPLSGNRNPFDGTLNFVGTYGYYWSSVADGTNSWNLYLYASGAGVDSIIRAYGFTVRCLKD